MWKELSHFSNCNVIKRSVVLVQTTNDAMKINYFNVWTNIDDGIIVSFVDRTAPNYN